MANERFQDLTRRPFPTRTTANRMQDAIEMLTRPYGNNGVGVELTSAGPEFSSTLPPRLQARITGKDDSVPPKYSWEEIGRDDAGVVIDHHDPRVGTADAWPAFERSGAEDVSTDGSFVAELVRGAGEYYEFSLGTGGGGGTLQKSTASSGSISIPAGQSRAVPFENVSGPFSGQGNGAFGKASDLLSPGIYILTGTVKIDPTECLAKYGAYWEATGDFDTVSADGMAITGSPSGDYIQIEAAVHLVLADSMNFDKIKFWVWHNSQFAVTATGLKFGVTYAGA